MTSLRFSKYSLLIAAVALWACGAAAAQQQPGGSGGTANQPGNEPGQQQPMPGQQASPNGPGGPGTGMAGVGEDNSAQSFADQSFLRKTMEDSVAQVQMGQLAAQKSSSDDVKQFGQKMAQIHEQLNNQLKPIAQKLDVSEPKGPSKKDKQKIEQMQSLSGPNFDAAFIKAMLDDQQADLKNFKDEAQGSQNPNVQQVAKMDEPVLSQHLQILEQLAQSHNVPVESKK